jgi:hypothetical protein
MPTTSNGETAVDRRIFALIALGQPCRAEHRSAGSGRSSPPPCGTRRLVAALIISQAWSPIGGITFYLWGESGSTLDDPTIARIAQAHRKTPAQVMLRWHLQQGRSAIPKSTRPERIAENFARERDLGFSARCS